MRTLIFLTLVAFSHHVWALTYGGPPTKTYEITAKLTIDGKEISQMKMITVEGDSAEISQVTDDPVSKLRLKVIASDAEDSKSDAIKMDVEMAYSNTEKHLEASPKIVSAPGEEAIIAVGSSPEKPGYELKLTAVRK